MKRLFKTAVALCLALIMTCSCFSAGFAGYAAQPAATNGDDVGFVYPVAITSAKMIRPLYIGLDNTTRTDSTYGEWNYFDPYNISKYVEATIEFSDGSTKVFNVFNNDIQAYSRYGNAISLNFNSTDLNTAKNPLEPGKTYTVPVKATLNYRYPYMIELESTVEIEVATASVTGIKAEATQAIPYEVGRGTGSDIFEFEAAKPNISLTLSDGGSLPLFIDENENNYQLYNNYINTSSSQDNGTYWGPNENHEFSVWFGREDDISEALFTTTMPVRVESYGKISSVTATVNSPFYESITGYYHEYLDRFSHSVSYLDIDFTISFENGHTVTVKGWTDEYWAYNINVYDEDSYKWKAGNTYPVKITKTYYENDDYTDYTVGTFNLDVLENPIKTIEIMTTGPAHVDEAWDDTDANNLPYAHYRMHESFYFYNVTFKDNSPALNNISTRELSRALGGCPILTEDQRINHWQVGKNTANIRIGNLLYPYEVWVVTDYYKDIRVKKGVEVIEGMFANEQYDWDRPYGENTYYVYNQYYLSAELEVELYDGTVITEYTGAKKKALEGPIPYGYVNYQWSGEKLNNQTYDTQWKVGDTFNLTLTASVSKYDNPTKNEFVLTVPVTVKANESPFKFDTYYENVNYSEGLGLSITGLKELPSGNTLNIPAEIYGYKVKKIRSLYSDSWLHCDIEKIYLPDTVKSITDYAFESLWSLKYIDLNMVEDLGTYSLIDCADELEIVVNPKNTAISYKNCVVYNSDFTEIKAITGKTINPVIEPTVKTVHNTDLVYYRYNTLTITGMDTHLEIVENNYGEPDPFPELILPKGSAAEADAIALGIEYYTTYGDLPMDDTSANMPVKITATSNANLPDDAVVNVSLVTDTAQNQVVYDITILSGGVAVQPEAKVTVAIDVPQGMQGQYCKVYRLEDDGTKTNMKATLIDGKLVFTTDHFSLYSVEEILYTAGDTNDDGEVTLDDVVLLAQYVAGWDVTPNITAANTNGDDEITLDDVVLLAQFVAGWDVNIDGENSAPTPTPPVDDSCNHIGCYAGSNGDGTHTYYCDSCNEPLGKTVTCYDDDQDGKCDECYTTIKGAGDVDINVGKQ